MFSSLLKLTLRNMYQDRLYSFINLFGLAVSFACFLMIFLYLRSEFTYDQHFTDHERIYRLTATMSVEGRQTGHAKVGRMVGPLLAQDYAQLEDFVRLQHVGGVGTLILNEDISRMWNSDTFFNTDNKVFDIFDTTVIAGNPGTALTEPRTVAISESMARYYFGDEDPVGKTLGIQIAANQFTVDLVFADLPENTSHRFDMLFSNVIPELPELTVDSENFLEAGIVRFNSYTFFRLPAAYDPEDFSSISADFNNRYVSAGAQQIFSGQDSRLDLQLQPLADIYFSPALQEDVRKGNPFIVYALSAVAIFIMGIASINYMNLSTARFAARVKEIGVRRTLGADRSQLIGQFLGEGVLYSLLALLVGISITELLFSSTVDDVLLGRDLSIFMDNNGTVLLQLILIAVGIGLVSCAYPAFYFSSVNPVNVFRPLARSSGFGMSLRGILIGLQMLVSISVIAGALVMYQQVNFMQNNPLGFEKENKLVVRINTVANGSTYRTLMTELARHPDIENVTMTDQIPGTQSYGSTVILKNEQGESVNVLVEGFFVDENYLETFAIPLVSGRNFAPDNRASTDMNSYPFLVNEALVRLMGWDDPIGKEVFFPTADVGGEVIGVVGDFNFASLHEDIQPLVMEFFYDNLRWQRYLVMDINPANLQEILPYVEGSIKTMAPETPFEYSFLDDTVNALYSTEENQTQLTLAGSGVCMVIAILGLFGLTSFTIDQKTREIGIRRVLGGSVTSILAGMFKGIFALIIAAGLVATVLVFYLLNIWLQGFAYRISISPLVFVAATAAVLLVSALTVAIQSLKVAGDRPVKALRYE